MLRKFQPGAVLVSMEADLAPPAIDAALEAGCHVLAEKPACLRADDFARLVRKAQAKHRHLMLTLANRVYPPVQEARRLIRDGKIGKVYGVELHLVADHTRLTRPAYRKQWFASKARAGGGILAWLGIHWLDLATYLTGLKVKQVTGFAGNVGGQPLDVEDAAVLALRFDNGALGTLTTGYYLDKGYHSHIKIWGESGWLNLAAVEGDKLELYTTKENEPHAHSVATPRASAATRLSCTRHSRRASPARLRRLRARRDCKCCGRSSRYTRPARAGGHRRFNNPIQMRRLLGKRGGWESKFTASGR